MELLDVADAFMPYCDGSLRTHVHVKIGVTQGRTMRLDEELVLLGLGDGDVVDDNLFGFL